MDALMVEIAGQRLHTQPGVGSWWLTEMEGLFDSPTSRLEEELIPGGHGAFEPDEVLFEPRRVVLRGTCESSSPGWADRIARPWLASLASRRDLKVRAFAGDSWLSLRGARVRGQVKVRDVDEYLTDWEIPVWTHDPRKYGREESFAVDAVAAPRGGLRFPIVDGALAFGESGAVSFPGAFQIHNPGSAGFYPVFRVAGPVDSFTVSSESLVLEYVAPVPAGQVLTLSPYAGGRAVLAGADVSHNLTRAGWVPVDPNQTRGYLFTPLNPGLGAQLEVTYPEGAWW